VPREARRILDLGTGDGRLLALLRIDRQEMLGVGLDFSQLMLEAARERFADDERIEHVTQLAEFRSRVMHEPVAQLPQRVVIWEGKLRFRSHHQFLEPRRYRTIAALDTGIFADGPRPDPGARYGEFWCASFARPGGE
jgi:SAM-dependent methyltransferase